MSKESKQAKQLLTQLDRKYQAQRAGRHAKPKPDKSHPLEKLYRKS